MKCTVFVLAIMIVLASLAIAAPYRQLWDLSGSPPRAQWFKDASTNVVDDAHYEFYDNAYSGGFPDYPWGGQAGSAAVSGYVTDIQYTPNRNIIGFTVRADITNDTYTCMWVMNGTSGMNYYGQSAPEIPFNLECAMYDVRLTLDFADAGLSPSPYGQVYAVGYDELAWYHPYMQSEPPQANPPYADYSVPTFRFGNLAPGQSASRSMTFGLWAPLPPKLDPLDPSSDPNPTYALLEDSKDHQLDIFANRTRSLKIGQYVSSLFQDDGSSWPGIDYLSSDVSVFFDSSPSCGAAYVQLGPNTPPNHYWWQNRYVLTEMIQMAVTAGPDEDVDLETMQLQASGWGNDRTGITAVETYLDVNGNGRVDSGETKVGTGVYDADDGICAFGFSQPVHIPAGGTVYLVVAYRMAPGIAYWSTFSFNAIHIRASGVSSGAYVPVYGMPVGSSTETVVQKPVDGITVGEAKKLELGRTVILRDKVQTAQYWSYYNWIEETNRSSGIRLDTVEIPGMPASGRNLITVLAHTTLEGAEAKLIVLEVNTVFDPLNSPPAPVAMNNKSTGGSTFGIQPGLVDDATSDPIKLATGLNSIGMLVRAWGVVTYVDPPNYGSRFWIDDGSNLLDGTLNAETQEPVRGMNVQFPSDWQTEDIPKPGDHVAVTGIMRCWDTGLGAGARYLWPRDKNDVVVIP